MTTEASKRGGKIAEHGWTCDEILRNLDKWTAAEKDWQIALGINMYRFLGDDGWRQVAVGQVWLIAKAPIASFLDEEGRYTLADGGCTDNEEWCLVTRVGGVEEGVFNVASLHLQTEEAGVVWGRFLRPAPGPFPARP